MSAARRARVRALAKINLDLRVLGKRPDGYHELRTQFQTISLHDPLEISYTPAPFTQFRVHSSIPILDNLALRAAEAVMDAARLPGIVDIRLTKQIPMGAGLGGGSSDAAAVLLALPVLCGAPLSLQELLGIAEELGSDVPFFLLGGRAAGLGRGGELYPLSDLGSLRGALALSSAHVSTAEAYAALSSRLTSQDEQNKIVSFQSLSWDTGLDCASNDFEQVVFERLPELAATKRRLAELGARPALMTGSGSAVFGLFRKPRQVSRAVNSLGAERVLPFTLVSRARYRAMWQRWLQPHTRMKQWPPRSRYAQ